MPWTYLTCIHLSFHESSTQHSWGYQAVIHVFSVTHFSAYSFHPSLPEFILCRSYYSNKHEDRCVFLRAKAHDCFISSNLLILLSVVYMRRASDTHAPRIYSWILQALKLTCKTCLYLYLCGFVVYDKCVHIFLYFFGVLHHTALIQMTHFPCKEAKALLTDFPTAVEVETRTQMHRCICSALLIVCVLWFWEQNRCLFGAKNLMSVQTGLGLGVGDTEL